MDRGSREDKAPVGKSRFRKGTQAKAGLLLVALAGLAAGGFRSSASAAQAPSPAPPFQRKYHLSDSHLHLVDFLQKTEGIKAVIAAMDRCGVDEAQITGMPFVKKWDEAAPQQPGYYLDDDARCYWYSATDALVAKEVMSAPERERKRFHPFICGFNCTDKNAVDHIRRMVEWYPGFWKGIGEVMGHHDDLSALAYGETARANNAGLDRVYDLAAELDLPVSIHNNIGSAWKREPIYVHEMDEAVSKHPRTRFIWCHAGISRRVVVPTLTQEVRRLLTAYSNLSVDISWVVYETYITQDGKPAPSWVELIEQFPDRFMIGSDKVGKFGNYEEEILKYNPLLDALKPSTARKVAKENFLALLPKKGATLKAMSGLPARPRGLFAFGELRPVRLAPGVLDD